LLLDRDAIDDCSVLIQETVNRLDAFIQLRDVGSHLRERIFVRHPADGSRRLLVIASRLKRLEECP
jgi:hypothetical protein